MATIKPVWTENVTLRAAATLAAATASPHDIDLDTLGADRADVTVDITIGSASSVTVEVLGSPDSGTTKDTTPLQSYEVKTNDRRTFSVTGAFRTINLVNNDGTNASGNIAIKYAWRNWNSA